MLLVKGGYLEGRAGFVGAKLNSIRTPSQVFVCFFLHTPSLISTFHKLLLFLIIITALLPNQPNKMNKDNEKEHCTERLALQD